MAKDEQGREVLVGLTFEQTAFVMDHKRRFRTKDRERDRDHIDKFLVLWDNHERARLAILGIEIAARQKPRPPSKSRGWIFVGCVAAYLLVAWLAFDWLAPILGAELANLLLLAVGVFVIHGAQKLSG
jgi:hypothetical protein